MIAFDKDGVLTDLHCATMMAREKGLPAPMPNELNDWWISRQYGMSLEEDDVWWSQNAVAAYQGDVLPEGAYEVLRWLRQHQQIAIITARPTQVEDVTVEWLQRNQVPYDRLVMGAEDKVHAARELGVTMFMEDSPTNAMRLAEAGIPVILRGWGYNRDVAHPLIQRIGHWSEVKLLLARHLNISDR